MKNKLLLFLSLVLMTLSSAWGQETTLAGWTFPETSGNAPLTINAECGQGTIYADGTNGSTTWMPVIQFFGGEKPSSELCNVSTATGSLGLASNGTSNNSKSIVFKISTIGFENLKLFYDTRGTEAGYTTHTWAYSTDAITFIDVKTITGRNATSFSSQTVEFENFPITNDQDELYIRLTLSGITASGSNANNNRLDNIRFVGTDISTDPSLSVSTESLSGFTYVFGNGPSAPQSLTITGENLTEEELIDLTILDDYFEISTTESGTYGDTLEMIEMSPTSNSVTIYIRLKKALAEGDYEGELGIESTIQDDVSITLSGTVTGEIPCGGLETFDNAINLPTETTYNDGSFVGNDGITWNYVHAQASQDYSINGQGILLRRSNELSSISATIQGGIGNFSADTRKAFTGNTQRKLELVINGNVIEQFEPTFANGESATVVPFVVNDINIAGEFTLELRLFGANGNQQITLDNISWTCYELPDFTWNGSVDTSWEEEENWTPNGTPTEDDSAWIPAGMPHYPAITGTALADKITVEEDASVKILEGGSLTVTNEMVNLGTAANFVVESGANLVQINDEAENTGDITVQGEFNFTEGRQQYNFTMSPVEGQDIRQIFGDGNTIPFALVYNEKTDYFVVPQTAEYANKNGFAIKEVEGSGTATMTANYVGGISNGEFSFPLKKEGQGFNVLGNPYPSNLDLYKLYTDNSDKIESTFFFWDNINNTNYEQEGSGYNGSNYASFNAASGTNGSGKAAPCKDCGAVKIPTKNIKVGTGFMIQAKEEGTLNYKNEYRTTENDGPNFFGKSNTETVEDDRYWLTLKKHNGISVMNVVVYFEGGKNEYAADDSQAFGSSDELYSWIEGYQLGIQGKSPFVVNDTIALGYRAFEAGEYQIDIFKQEGVFGNGTTIYLVDQDLDMVHNLSEGTYHFKTEAGEFNERFLIIYEEDEVLNTIDFANADIQVYRQDKTTVIRSLAKDLSELKIYNLNGQLLLHEDQLSGKYYHLPEGRLGKQVLLLNVKTADGKVHSFKILTY